jgi:hypothetical protein
MPIEMIRQNEGSALIQVIMGFAVLMITSGLLADIYINSQKANRTSVEAQNFQLLTSKILGTLSQSASCATAFGVVPPKKPGKNPTGKQDAPLWLTPGIPAPVYQWPAQPNAGIQLDGPGDVLLPGQPYMLNQQQYLQILPNPAPGGTLAPGNLAGITLQAVGQWDPSLPAVVNLKNFVNNGNGVNLVPLLLTVNATASTISGGYAKGTVRSAQFYLVALTQGPAGTSSGKIVGCFGQGAGQMVQAEICSGLWQPWGNKTSTVGSGLLGLDGTCVAPSPNPGATKTCN